MKKASRLQQLKEQLMQAVDAQNNIQNMVAMLDVICRLESYPMTKEALVETRLGKLINDVRKRSTDEDLVKRLKNLVRRWQALVGIDEGKEKVLSSLADNANLISAERTGSTQTLTEHYSQTIFQDRVEMSTTNYSTSFRKSKIPVLANRLYSSSIKHLQQFASFRTSLPNQHCQDDHNGFIRDQQKLQKCSISHILEAEEAGQSTCITSPIQDSSFQQSSDTLKILKPAALNANLNNVSSTVTDTNMRTRSLNHTVKLSDPHTQQIKTESSKSLANDCQRSVGSEGTEHLEESFCSFQQTNQRLIQNSLLTSERSRVDFSVGEKDLSKVCRKEHTLIPGFLVTDLPGVSREVTERDLARIRSQRWHGVNGCYDSRNNWYDWTQSITLDPYGDGSKLNISPYVNIDYRL